MKPLSALSTLIKQTRFVRTLLEENGLLWTTYFGVHFALSYAVARADSRLQHIEKSGSLPGLSSAAMNKKIWESFDWTRRGEEWTSSEELKRSIIDDLLQRYLPQGGTLLELGPGGGRWSAELASRARELILVDVSQSALDVCRQRLTAFAHVQYVACDGRGLAGVPSGSVDGIWSWDAFVHVQPDDTESYIREFARVLRPGGIGVIHHPGGGGSHGGFRSRVTGPQFAGFLREAGLTVVSQFDEWTTASGQRFGVRFYRDVVSIFRAEKEAART